MTSYPANGQVPGAAAGPARQIYGPSDWSAWCTGMREPHVKLELIDRLGVVVAKGETRIDGSFRLLAPAPGQYSLCWNIQGHAGCRREMMLVEGANALRRIDVRIPGNLVFGRVLTADRRACWVRDPFFKLDVATRVSLVDPQNQSAAPTTRANADGYYLCRND